MENTDVHTLTLRLPAETSADLRRVAKLNVRSVRAEIEVAVREHVKRHQYNVFIEQDGRRVLVQRCIANSPDMVALGMNLQNGPKAWIVEPVTES